MKFTMVFLNNITIMFSLEYVSNNNMPDLTNGYTDITLESSVPDRDGHGVFSEVILYAKCLATHMTIENYENLPMTITSEWTTY